MIDATINKNIRKEDFIPRLIEHFKGCKVKQTFFKKEITVVLFGPVMASVSLHEDGFDVKGGLNFYNYKIILPIALSAMIYLIGAFILMLIFYIIYAKRMKKLENEVKGFLEGLRFV